MTEERTANVQAELIEEAKRQSRSLEQIKVMLGLLVALVALFALVLLVNLGS